MTLDFMCVGQMYFKKLLILGVLNYNMLQSILFPNET